MLLLKGYTKQPYYIMMETDDELYDIHDQRKPFVDTEIGKDIYIEKLIEEWKKKEARNPFYPVLRAVHCWPLAWNECKPA
jgi:hypothetical protein